MNTRKILSILVGFLFLGAAISFGFLPERRQAADIPVSAAIVKVAPISTESIRQEFRFSGITRAADQAVLSFSISGRLMKRSVEVGDRVSAGQVIARLDVREFDNAVDSARAAVLELKARLAQGRRDRQRLDRLIEDGAAAVKDLEHAAAAVETLSASLLAAQVRLREARRTRSEAELRAPFSGIITTVRLEPGEWAEPGKPVVEISGDSKFELEVDVPEVVIGHLKEGDDVRVMLPFFDGKRLNGKVSAAARAALSSGRLFPIVVDLEPVPELTAGLTAELVLTIQTESKPIVPVDAIINPGASRPYIFVVDKGYARKVFIKLGSFHKDRVVVSGDLEDDAKVVVAGHTMLSDGKRLEARQ